MTTKYYPDFTHFPEGFISTDTSLPVDESVDIEAVRERLMKMTDDPRVKRMISHMGTITDPAFRRYPEIPALMVEEG